MSKEFKTEVPEWGTTTISLYDEYVKQIKELSNNKININKEQLAKVLGRKSTKGISNTISRINKDREKGIIKDVYEYGIPDYHKESSGKNGNVYFSISEVASFLIRITVR